MDKGLDLNCSSPWSGLGASDTGGSAVPGLSSTKGKGVVG